VEKKLTYWLATVLALIFLFFIGVVIFNFRIAQAPEVKVEPEFRGPPPGVVPYVKGPTGPPPSLEIRN
jgi:hypothetical protein